MALFSDEKTQGLGTKREHATFLNTGKQNYLSTLR